MENKIFLSNFSLICFNVTGNNLLENILPTLINLKKQKKQLRGKYCDLIVQSKRKGGLTSTYNVLFSFHPSGCHSRELKRQKHKRRKWPVLMSALWDHFQPYHPISHLTAVPQNHTYTNTRRHTCSPLPASTGLFLHLFRPPPGTC